jgi:hypothetical protein
MTHSINVKLDLLGVTTIQVFYWSVYTLGKVYKMRSHREVCLSLHRHVSSPEQLNVFCAKLDGSVPLANLILVS